MPQIPTDGCVRLPQWVVGLPWVLLALALAIGGWAVSALQRQVADKEETNAALRRQGQLPHTRPPSSLPAPSHTTWEALHSFALGTLLELAQARDWSTAYTLVPEYLPGLVERLGPAPELREIAVTGLTLACSSFLNHPGEQSPAFSADSRWIITRFADGTLVFSDVNFLDPDTFILKVGAKDFRVDEAFLYYQTDVGWQRAAFRSPADGQAELGPAEAFAGTPPEPARPSPSALILPQVSGIPARLLFKVGQDPALPVHQWQVTRAPYSVVLSPDGRVAAVWIEKGVIQIWRLALLRERLARIGLDWDIPPFLPAGNDEKIEGSIKGAEAVPSAWRTAIPAQSGSPVHDDSPGRKGSQPRRRVVLPSIIPNSPPEYNVPKSFPNSHPRQKVTLPVTAGPEND